MLHITEISSSELIPQGEFIMKVLGLSWNLRAEMQKKTKPSIRKVLGALHLTAQLSWINSVMFLRKAFFLGYSVPKKHGMGKMDVHVPKVTAPDIQKNRLPSCRTYSCPYIV